MIFLCLNKDDNSDKKWFKCITKLDQPPVANFVFVSIILWIVPVWLPDITLLKLAVGVSI